MNDRLSEDSPAFLRQLDRLADSALGHAGNGLVSESDTQPSIEFLYTETHLALLLFLLHRSGTRPDGLSQAAARLRAWDRLQVAPTFFNSLAITLLILAMREWDAASPELASVLSSIQARRKDNADQAWRRHCGNNMYLQQLVTDALLAPLADARPLPADAAERLGHAFASCMSDEGYFFDLPRPGAAAQRQFPFTYNLKCLLLLALSCRYLPDARLERRLRQSLAATLPLFTSSGDCSYFGRTDQTTFAAGLAVFCLRAAASRDVGGEPIRRLASRAEHLFSAFPIGEDGCLEVNRYPLPSSVNDRLLSRDSYAYRWQYAISGAAYALLARHYFPVPGTAASQEAPDEAPAVFSSSHLGLVRAKAGDLDLFIRTGSNHDANDRRHAGPTILRLEHGERILTGAIPVTVSSDSPVAVPWSGRSAIARHLDLLRYRWRHGFEALQWELAGFVPVLREGHRAWIPAPAAGHQIGAYRLVTVHRYQSVHASGWVPAWNHVAELAALQMPQSIHPLFRKKPLVGSEAPFQLTRAITWTATSVSIADRITGAIGGKTLVVATRSLTGCGIAVRGAAPGATLQAWSSDGPQAIHLYETRCEGAECAYEIILSAPDS